VALDQLQAILPNVGAVSLIVGWFGDDLRAGTCTIRPGVDAADKVTAPLAWSVAGQSRASAHLVSSVDGRAAYGGTPSDETVVAAIQDLDARGIAVTVAPFIFMDVAAGKRAHRPLHRRRLSAPLSLARPHHLLARIGPARQPRQDRRRRHPGRRLHRFRRRLGLRHRR